ncbi:MAG: hypothetical protein WCJ30_21765 [Deltaproteobacteria bacterium]
MLAPIDKLEVRLAESQPVQVFVDITSGLPGGCARFDHYTVNRASQTISIAVWNTMPAIDGPCTAIYGFVPHTIALGSGFPAGVYVVRANDVTTTFAVQ